MSALIGLGHNARRKIGTNGARSLYGAHRQLHKHNSRLPNRRCVASLAWKP